MILRDLLQSRGFVSALIVDDAFEEVPTAADLAMEDDAWPNFMDDLRVQEELIQEIFPDYAKLGGPELRESDGFVAALWGSKGRLNADLWKTLFGAYERQRSSDRELLERLKARLEATGLQVTTVGRTIPPDARGDIIFADLFFRAAQRDFDIDESIAKIKTLLEGRRSSPPPVVLMSSSGRLNEKKERFRDEAEMLGALFRVYQKSELLDRATVETTLERFATHHVDAVKVAAFVEAWKSGLEDATKSFMGIIRRLDLSDYTNIRRVLLEAEGQPLGSYLLDVFDRVLQHEIEGHSPTIAAAEALKGIDPNIYPTPYVAGSPDLQNLVARTIWQHTERLKVAANTAGMPVSFGDVLVRTAKLADVQAPPIVDRSDALVVLTPACDLVRAQKRRVLLVGGSLAKLDQKTWKYKTAGAITPILQFTDGSRMSITWELDDQRMLQREELTSLIVPGGPYQLAACFRESNALELQQRMLADMGRVGLVSKMPFTFEVDVAIFMPEPDGSLKQLDIPVTTSDRGVCITGRDGKGDITHLILTEPSVDEILRTVLVVDPDRIHPRAKATLERLQTSASFRSELQRGLPAPGPTTKGRMQIKVPAETGSAEAGRQEIVGLIVRNPGEFTSLSGNELSNGGIVIVLTDREPDAVLVGDILAAEASGGLAPENQQAKP